MILFGKLSHLYNEIKSYKHFTKTQRVINADIELNHEIKKVQTGRHERECKKK